MPPKKSKATQPKAKAAKAVKAPEPSVESTGTAKVDVDGHEEDAAVEADAAVNPDAASEKVDAQESEGKDTAQEPVAVEEEGKDTAQEPVAVEKAQEIDGNEDEANTENQEETTEVKPATKSKKRKAEESTKVPAKASRRSARGSDKAQPSQQHLLNFLLSDEAADMCRPEDEIADLDDKGNELKTYATSALSPFEELLCAVILSRPISHRLGLRTIRTVLNEPYGFNSPAAIRGATPEQRHQAMFDARTQHKDKTASQIGMLADVVASEFGKDDKDTSLEKLRSIAKKDWDSERDLLQKQIKGLGKTGLDIFFRRVQWLWPEAFPFVDERTARGIEKLGLPKNPNDLLKVINENWSKLNTSGLPKADKEGMKRRVFVVVCERATGADLEGKTDALLERAATS